MRIVIAGGSGFLGRAIAGSLDRDGHVVTILARRPERANEIAWEPRNQSGAWTEAVKNADVVINLAGESMAGQRWTPARKLALHDSRIIATRALATALTGAGSPTVFLSGSAIGYYGTGNQPVTEEAPPGTDFLAGICRDWEEAALTAPATRIVLLRTGVVLGRDGGALAELARPFQFFAGGPIGSGDQIVSWIHVEDWVGLVRWAIDESAASGPLNLTAPHPVSNADLAQALGQALHRPSMLRAPAFAVRLAVGEMADAAILSGQNVLPAKAQRLGYAFRFPEITAALADLYPAG